MLVVVTFPVSHTMLRTAVAAGLRGGSVRMSATATQTRSALLEQTGLPKFDEIETPSVKPAVQDVLANISFRQHEWMPSAFMKYVLVVKRML